MDDLDREGRKKMHQFMMSLAAAVANWQKIPENDLSWFAEVQRRAELHFGESPELLRFVTRLRQCLEEYPTVQSQYTEARENADDEEGRQQAFERKRQFEARYRPYTLIKEGAQAFQPYLAE
jgi:hypothetical protein